MKKIIVISTVLLFVFCISKAQNKFEKATADAVKLEKKSLMDFPRERGKNGKGYAPYYPALKTPPKKVALVSFAITDPGYSKKKNTPNATVFSTVSTSEGLVKIIVNAYKNVAIEPLKKTFAEYGMEVLTPDEFLDTDEKKGFYMDFEFTPKEHFVNKLAVTSSNVHMAAEGYRFIVPMYDATVFKGSEGTYSFHLNEFKNKEIYEQLGYELCKGLDVDAVLMVNSLIMTEDKLNTDILGVAMIMFGPNPISLEPGEKEGPLYRKGNLYCALRCPIGAPTKDTDDPAGNVETDGYENIMIGMATKMGVWLKEETAQEDKR